METEIYQLKSRVRYSETDENGRLSLTGIINYLQDCCTMQAEDLGIGLPYLFSCKMGWFVTNYQIKLCGPMPGVGQEIVVKTWAYKLRGMLGNRNFTIEDSLGNRLVEADSLWVLMDLENLRPKRLPQEMLSAYGIFPQLSGDWNLGKRQYDFPQKEAMSFVVSPLHLDTNGHMNNAKYLEAAKACIGKENLVSQIYIEFKKSAMLGDEVFCTLSSGEENEQIVQMKNDAGELFAAVSFFS